MTNTKIIFSTIVAITITSILLATNSFPGISAQTLSPSSPCPPSGQVEHWDKIVFQITEDKSNKVPKNKTLDLKILDAPGTIVNLEQAVIDKIASQYGLNSSQKQALKVEIKNVLYETVTCGLSGPAGPNGATGSTGSTGVTGTEGNLTLTSHRASVDVDSGDFGSKIVSCPSGEFATGGGAVFGAGSIAVTVSEPDPADDDITPTGWLAGGKNDSISTATLFVWVICAQHNP